MSDAQNNAMPVAPQPQPAALPDLEPPAPQALSEVRQPPASLFLAQWVAIGAASALLISLVRMSGEGVVQTFLALMLGIGAWVLQWMLLRRYLVGLTATQWVGYSFLGGLVAGIGVVFLFIVIVGLVTTGSPPVAPGAPAPTLNLGGRVDVAIASGLITGLSFGYILWLLLRRYFGSSSTRWIVANVLGLMLVSLAGPLMQLLAGSDRTLVETSTVLANAIAALLSGLALLSMFRQQSNRTP